MSKYNIRKQPPYDTFDTEVYEVVEGENEEPIALCHYTGNDNKAVAENIARLLNIQEDMRDG